VHSWFKGSSCMHLYALQLLCLSFCDYNVWQFCHLFLDPLQLPSMWSQLALILWYSEFILSALSYSSDFGIIEVLWYFKIHFRSSLFSVFYSWLFILLFIFQRCLFFLFNHSSYLYTPTVFYQCSLGKSLASILLMLLHSGTMLVADLVVGFLLFCGHKHGELHAES
jgi:hypothetical protein